MTPAAPKLVRDLFSVGTPLRMRISVRSSTPRRARALQEALAGAGMEAVAFLGPNPRFDAEDVAVLDAAGEARDWALAEAGRLKALAAPPAAVVSATFSPEPPRGGEEAFDDWIALDAAPALIRRALNAARRSGIAREELSLRLETAARCGGAPALAASQSNWRALYIGEPHPFFLALERAMAREDGKLEAAFSSFMGFDFLHDDRFDAVALNANADAATALALCGALRRNARLHHLPTLMLCDNASAEFCAAAIDRGASLIVDREGDHDTAIAWMFARIRSGRREAQVESGLAAVRAAYAGASTLFGANFFHPHMEALAQAAHISGRPLTLAGLRVELAPGARRATASGWRRGVHQVAEICGRIIRAEDCAALLDGDVIVIALPGCSARDAIRAAERVVSVAECTAFAAGEADAGPILLDRTVHELAAGESGAGLLARTLASFDRQDVRA
jgi:two-component system, cell cycle response regulator PopA